ncbi:MAG: hypothetical protein ACYDDF_11680 [Thermoplasmatota archaeon]
MTSPRAAMTFCLLTAMALGLAGCTAAPSGTGANVSGLTSALAAKNATLSQEAVSLAAGRAGWAQANATIAALRAACPSNASMDGRDMSGMSMGGMSSTMAPVSSSNSSVHYNITGFLGPQEPMLRPCQAGNATSGEVMVGGTMMSPSSMGMGMGSVYHLEVHVRDHNGDTVVVPLANISIDLSNATGASHNCTVAEMYGIAEGLTDLHYGNNVQLTAGIWTVAVTVNGERVNLHLHAS